MKITNFIAEIKKCQSRKTPSLDIEYSVTFTSDDPHVMLLAHVDADKTVKVVVEEDV